jgi:hypothetical protein
MSCASHHHYCALSPGPTNVWGRAESRRPHREWLEDTHDTDFASYVLQYRFQYSAQRQYHKGAGENDWWDRDGYLPVPGIANFDREHIRRRLSDCLPEFSCTIHCHVFHDQRDGNHRGRCRDSRSLLQYPIQIGRVT